jgi:hypothetical protein
MGWTTGKSTAQMAAVLVTAGALQDQANNALHSGGWKANVPVELWGVLVQCTNGWNGGDPVWEYDNSPTLSNTNQTVTQMVAALVSAGAIQDQAVQVCHALAWTPNKPVTRWGVLVQCTSGWNSTAAPVYSYTTSPS